MPLFESEPRPRVIEKCPSEALAHVGLLVLIHHQLVYERLCEFIHLNAYITHAVKPSEYPNWPMALWVGFVHNSGNSFLANPEFMGALGWELSKTGIDASYLSPEKSAYGAVRLSAYWGQ